MDCSTDVKLKLVEFILEYEFSPCLTPDLLYGHLQELSSGTSGLLKAPQVILVYQQDRAPTVSPRGCVFLGQLYH